eukprot:3364823-Prymnesium_polylepis.1
MNSHRSQRSHVRLWVVLIADPEGNMLRSLHFTLGVCGTRRSPDAHPAGPEPPCRDQATALLTLSGTAIRIVHTARTRARVDAHAGRHGAPSGQAG